jgi:CDP-glucose 4,6-dehydratase
VNSEFWRDKRVAVTGHTGFKGPWLCGLLRQLGAQVRGYSLPAPTKPSLFELARVADQVPTVFGDIRDTAAVAAFLEREQPQVLFHMAAQSVVLDSYTNPIESYSTNVVGTASVFEALRRTQLRCAVVNVTTDKVYANRGWVWGYRETDELGGNDPYAGSKACAELVAASFRSSYFPVQKYTEHGVAIGCARAGNVIGGGDWTPHQLVPEAIASFARAEPVTLRYPGATRPWQHVLDCLSGYVTLGEKLVTSPASASGAWNFGPRERHPPTVAELAQILGRRWGLAETWRPSGQQHAHEERVLSIDSSKAEAELGWRPRLSIATGLEWLADWHLAFQKGSSPADLTQQQIERYVALSREP